VPSILIINQPQVLMPLEDSAFQKLIQKSFAQSLSAFWDLAHSVIVPDLPPPYTISGASLEGLLALKRKIKYAGFFVHRPKEKGLNVRDRFNLAPKLIYAPISGPAPTRAFLVDLLIKVMAFLPTGVSLVVSRGDAGVPISVHRHGQHMILGWDDLRRDFMGQADLIVCRGGQTTIGEAILNGKPMAIFPIPLHGEQVENAKKSAKMGFARLFDQYTPDPKGVATDLVHMMEDKGLAFRAEAIRDVAMSFDAQNIVAQEVYELISRQPA
jgi:UDP:flavonoid glycosyltransferase YjiC (YdhE family)